MTRRGLGGIARRLVLMVGGEAMQSGFHFVLNIALIHALPAEGYGVFALVMVIGGLGLTYVRSFTAMPAVVWIGASRSARAADAFEVMFGSGALAIATVLGAGVAVLLQVWLAEGALAGGVFVGAWAMRSHLRVAFFARGWPKLVSGSDLAFTVGGALFAGAALRGSPTLAGVFTALAAANLLGIVVLLAGARRPVRITFRRTTRRRAARLLGPLGWSGLGVTLANLQGQGIALLVAAFAGPAAYAPIAAMLVLFVPLRLAASALVNMIQPELATLLARGERAAVWRRCWAWTAFTGVVGVGYGAAMMLLLPFVRAPALEGSPMLVIGVFAWVIYATTMFYTMPRIALEAMAAFRAVAIVTGVGAVVGLVAIRLILLWAPSAWALGGGALSEVVVLVGSWWALRIALPPQSHAIVSSGTLAACD